jgi:CTP:molybdopterin cytidylyltransferase MocA
LFQNDDTDCDANPILLGHPVYVPFALNPKIKALPKDAKVRELLLEKPYRGYTTSDPSVLDDIDTPEAYASLCRKYHK